LTGGKRPGYVKALHGVATELGQTVHGGFALDPLGHYAGAERVPEVDNPGYHEWLAPIRELPHEGPVDLQLLELDTTPTPGSPTTRRVKTPPSGKTPTTNQPQRPEVSTPTGSRPEPGTSRGTQRGEFGAHAIGCDGVLGSSAMRMRGLLRGERVRERSRECAL